MSDAGGHRPRNILVVEDEPAVLQLVTKLLGEEGYTVRAATDGGHALELIAKERFDVVVLDVMMPKLDGFGVLAHLKESGALQHTRVLMLTSLGKDSDWLKGFKSGAHDYLTKPFDHKDLLVAIRRLIDLKPSEVAAYRDASIERTRVLAQLESIFDN